MWLTWRQYRTQLLVAVGALAVLAVILLLTGPSLAHLYSTTVATCKTHNDCSTAKNSFLLNDADLQTTLNVLVVVVPGILGVFWAAPLIARELETGTYRLAWTQSVTRIRWLAVKVGVIGLASMAVAGLLSLMVTWWSAPFDRVTMNPFGSFDERDIVPVAYAAFAFAIGVTLGMLTRRTVPAMAATAVAFVATRVAVLLWLRPNLNAPLHLTVPDTIFSNRVSAGTPLPRDWIISTQTINATGRVIGEHGIVGSGLSVAFGKTHGVTIAGVGSCPTITFPPLSGPLGGPGPAGPAVAQRCLDELGVRDLLTYQPAGRYWTFQWCELAIFIVLALLLGGICFWWVRRRLV
jgi:ABC-type transport system involved in multi-copper enzyme maturation permease subunit